MRDYEKDFLEKYDAGEDFSEDELSSMPWDYSIVDTINGENHRWDQEVTTVFRVGERLFSLDWGRGLTEMQVNSFYEQPVEVRRVESEKTITVVSWVPVRCDEH